MISKESNAFANLDKVGVTEEEIKTAFHVHNDFKHGNHASNITISKIHKSRLSKEKEKEDVE